MLFEVLIHRTKSKILAHPGTFETRTLKETSILNAYIAQKKNKYKVICTF